MLKYDETKMRYSVESSSVAREIIRLMYSIHKEQEFQTSLYPDRLDLVVDTMLDCPERPTDFKFGLDEKIAFESNEICLTSGGADSTINWFLKGKPPGLYINIGQEYANKERQSLALVGIPYHYIDLKVYNFSSTKWKHIIPGRNLLFLTIAAEMLDEGGIIHFSVINGEGYDSDAGDKSKRFINRFITWYGCVTGKKIYIETMHKHTKGQWLSMFMQSGGDINLIRYKTVTCFSVEGGQCGRCQACLRKFLSFMYNNIDTSKDYRVHPMIGGTEFVKKYKLVLPKALDEKDFSHYSEHRCKEDLAAIRKAEELL